MTGAKEKPKPPTIQELEEQGRTPWKPAGNPYTGPLTFADLFAQLTDYFRQHLDLTDERYYHVLAAWTLHTWRIHDYRASGPLWIMGPISSGKTTVLECLDEVAYRGIRGGSMSNSTMFRLSDSYTPTLLIDESQIYNKDEWFETQAFLNERYRKGGKVWRVNTETMLPEAYNAYGATAFAASSPPWEAMASRALVIQMEKGQPRQQTLTPMHEKEGLELRQKLKAFADRWVNPQTMRDDTELYPETVERYLTRLSNFRVREVGVSLLEMAPDTGPREQISSYLEDLQKVHDAEETTGYLSDYVLALKNSPVDKGLKIEAGDIRKQLALVRGVDPDKPGKGFPGSKGVMKAMRTLGFKPTRTTDNKAGVLEDKALLARLLRRYKLAPPTLQDAPDTPPTPAQREETGVSGESGANQTGGYQCEYCDQQFEDHKQYEKHRCPKGSDGQSLANFG